MGASRLCLNANRMHVLGLGSRHNVDSLTVHDVQVLASTAGASSAQHATSAL